MKLPIRNYPNPAEGPFDAEITSGLYSSDIQDQLSCLQDIPSHTEDFLTSNIFLETALNEVEYTLFEADNSSENQQRLLQELPNFIKGMLATGIFDLDTGILPDRTRFYALAFRGMSELDAESAAFSELYDFIKEESVALTDQLNDFISYEEEEDASKRAHSPEYEYFNESGRKGQWYLYNAAAILSLMDVHSSNFFDEYTEAALLRPFLRGVDSMLGVLQAGDDIFGTEEYDESIFYNYASVLFMLQNPNVIKLLKPEQQKWVQHYYDNLPEYSEETFE